MSDAAVEFLTLEGCACPNGQQPARFTFRCVNRNKGRDERFCPVMCANLLIAGATDIKRDGQGLNGGRPQWDWDGSRDKPTFSPSIDCEKHCGWHGYIRNGRCVDVNGNDEPNS